LEKAEKKKLSYLCFSVSLSSLSVFSSRYQEEGELDGERVWRQEQDPRRQLSVRQRDPL